MRLEGEIRELDPAGSDILSQKMHFVYTFLPNPTPQLCKSHPGLHIASSVGAMYVCMYMAIIAPHKNKTKALVISVTVHSCDAPQTLWTL